MWHILRYIVFGALGSLPGFVIVVFGGNLQIGLPIVVLGLVVGAVLAHPAVLLGRTFRLLLGFLFARNIPLFTDRVMDWVDREDSKKPADDEDDRLMIWLLAWDVEKRRGWIVLIGFVVGLLIGIAVAAYEYRTITETGRGVILTEPVKDPGTVFIMFPFVGSIWMASLVGTFASAAYRRPILFSGPVGAFISGCLGLSAGSFVGLTLIGATAAIGIGLLVASLAALDKPTDDKPINMNQ